MWVTQKYLTDVWKLSFTHAAGILNIYWGLALILPVGFIFLVDAFLGNYKMLVLSSLTYSVGMGLLTMSTPPVLASSTGTCKNYKPKCIGSTQKFLFYTALVLVAIGASGHLVSLKTFLEEQEKNPNGDKRQKDPLQLPGLFMVAFVPIIGAIVLPSIKPWSLRYGIPAICTAVATLVFLSGSWSYYKSKPKGSPLTNVRRWRLCTIAEAKEAKIVVRMVPMWMTFIICGTVSSIGNTYFQEQANHMNPNLGKWKVPVPIFLTVVNISTEVIGSLYDCMSKERSVLFGCQIFAPRVGIAVAMIFSVLCCITAARMETRRLGVIRSHNLYEKPEAKIPMSMFWLTFQFLLLAGLYSVLRKSVEALFRNQAPESMTNYLLHITKGVSGLGYMGSVLSVYLVSKVSEKGGRQNWFKYTLNRSRLDRYYWVLAALSSINLIFYIFIASRYKHKEPEPETEPEQKNKKDPQNGDSA
ncbi:protein NRT1/ PTR FAMILY 5.5-like [Olea europaea var. sylvestris]|uniref:protein NRT1/ PTR FAMILY 5.5-like n=1 Tax=Olea europaea var. sylvestris TaxID=158386 RepID=UPI000C1CDBA2|nr:protein NRT1/ PTR FAMILY 5.5-like [Olea europaea var. sylvestris]